jgi:hypothetical protein
LHHSDLLVRSCSLHIAICGTTASSKKFPQSDNPCWLNRSMQHFSNLLIRERFSKRPDPLGCTQLNPNRTVFSLN